MRSDSLRLSMEPVRVVSLAASNTEIVCALGMAHRLVGVDSHSDYPPEVVAGLPKLGPDLHIDVEKVRALAPDLVLASLSVPGMESVVEGLALAGLPYVAVKPAGLDGVFQNIQDIGHLLGVPDRASRLVANLRARVLKVQEQAARVDRRWRVYWEWWPRPLISPGGPSWITHLCQLAGGSNLFADSHRESLVVSPDEVVARDPEVIVLCYCGARKLPDPASLLRRPGWEDTTAVRAGRVYAVLEPLFGRPGPRLVDGLELLAALLHPEAFAKPPGTAVARLR